MHAIDDFRNATRRCILAAFLTILVLCPGLAFQALAANENLVTVKTVALITSDDDGRNLSYPSAIYFDSTEEEIYLVNGGSGRVVVYGPDFFPRMSIGAGRSVAYPRGLQVTKNGQVYICQGVNRANPVRRVTILNGAFFVDREIFLDEVPEAAGFSPKQLAVSRDGTIYLSSDRDRGVLVLDKEGNFLRWLKPMDMVASRKDMAETEQQSAAEEEKALEAAAAEGQGVNGSRPDIPEEFRPRSVDAGGAPTGPGLGPVKVHHVTIDSVGNLYLLSAETSKVYVYGPDEAFQFSFGEKGGTPRKMSQPRSMAVDEKNKLIYVADYTRHTVLVFDLAGTYLYEFGGRGYRPGSFNFPSGIAVNRQGQVIVADLFNKRVQVLDVQYLGMFPKFGESTSASSPEEATEKAGEAAPDAGTPVAPEAEAAAEATPDASGQPDDVVEEVIIPAQELPAQPDAESAKETGSESPAEQPAAGSEENPAPAAPLEQPAVGSEEKASPVVAPLEQPAVGSEENPAPAAPLEQPAVGGEEKAPPVVAPPR